MAASLSRSELLFCPAPPSQLMRAGYGVKRIARSPTAAAAAGEATPTGMGLATKRCVPCEEAKDALEVMGMTMKMERAAAETLLSQLSPAWQLVEDAEGQLRLRRLWRSKNFVKGLELCHRIGDVAEAEGHHPDLHLTGWNNIMVEIWTHSRQGLSENDFILAAKIEALELSDLLSKKQPPTPRPEA